MWSKGVQGPLVIVHLAPEFGGAERSMARIANHLDPELFPVVWVVGPELLRPHLNPERVRLIPVPEGTLGTWFSTPDVLERDGERLGDLLAPLAPAVVLGMMHYSAAVSWAARRRRRLNYRLVANFRGPAYEYFRCYVQDPLYRRFIRQVVTRICWGAERVIVPARGMKVELVRRFYCPPWAVRVIANGIDLAEVQRAAAEPALGMLDPAPGLVRLVAIARLAPEKHLDQMLRALKLLDGSLKVRLAIVGEGSERANLASLIQDLGLEGRVDLLGYRANVFPYVQQADLVLHSCEYEGFPNAVLEAMACAKPVIAEDCPYGPREIIGRDQFGILVPPKQPERLARAIESLVGNPERRRELGRAALAEAGRYTLERMVSAHGAVLAGH